MSPTPQVTPSSSLLLSSLELSDTQVYEPQIRAPKAPSAFTTHVPGIVPFRRSRHQNCTHSYTCNFKLANLCGYDILKLRRFMGGVREQVTLSHSQSFSLTRSHSFSLTHSHSLSLTLIHSLSLSLSRSRCGSARMMTRAARGPPTRIGSTSR